MKSSKPKLYEKDLYGPVKAFFESLGYEVKSEVDNCDVVAKKDDDITIVELKLRLNLDVILQAASRQKISGKVYIAIPLNKEYHSKRFKNICYLLRRLEIGLLVVKLNNKPSVVPEIDSVPFDRNKSMIRNKYKLKSLKKEFDARHGDQNVGGVTGKKIVTSYREKVLLVAGLLQMYGPMSAKQLKKLGADDHAYSFLYDNHYNWFVKESKGIYGLTEKGESELSQYRDLLDVLLKNRNILPNGEKDIS